MTPHYVTFIDPCVVNAYHERWQCHCSIEISVPYTHWTSVLHGSTLKYGMALFIWCNPLDLNKVLTHTKLKCWTTSEHLRSHGSKDNLDKGTIC